jgi:DNA-binding MarR family transcriptional regulator
MEIIRFIFVCTIKCLPSLLMKSSESRFSQCIYFSSNAFARKVEKLAMQSWESTGLPPSHAYLLLMVLEQPGAQPGMIAREMQLTPSTITRLAQKLEQKELVTRAVEGKITRLSPTAKARELEPVMKRCLQAFSAKLVNILGQEETSRMVGNINRLSDQLP